MNSWWHHRDFFNDVQEALAHYSEASSKESDVEFCEFAFKGLNVMWSAHQRSFGQSPDGNRPSDSKSIQNLMLAIADSCQRWLLGQASICRLAELEPKILNHDILRNSLEYRPGRELPVALIKKASDEHGQLTNAFMRWNENSTDDARTAALKKLAQLLYVVRSNIAHGEKTEYGPDLSKAKRDRLVCSFAHPVVEDVFEALFEQPGERLAIYGTLAPGGANREILERISGRWTDGTVEGKIETGFGLPLFIWQRGADKIPVKVLWSSELPKRWTDLDRFEGEQYRRVLVPIEEQKEIMVANIYSRRSRNYL
ncbi:MAG: hypothetical protein HY611_01155 [Elusimicrobia bacterium]|nr:hypothetical protein [Elusimicrobiota bacterium]